MVIVHSDNLIDGTYTIDCETLDEAVLAFREESNFLDCNGGPEASIDVIEVARFIDIV